MKKFVAATAIMVGLMLAVFGAWYLTNSPLTYSGMSEPVSIGYSPFESVALLCIAEDQNFFRHNGLNLTLHKYDTGVGALDGMLNDESDIAVGANEFPLVGRAFQEERISTIGCIAKSEFIYLIGRKDRGIEKVTDLKGKRVGTTFRTIAHFYLGRFLELHGMSMQDIAVIDIKTPADWVNAIVSGDIDAIATAQPYANLIEDSLGANAVVWSAQSSQPLYTQVISTNEWITKHPELTARFLKSLAEAEEYANTHPAEANSIAQKKLNLDANYMKTVWRQNQFSLSLDQSLITAMEDEARWMIINNLTTEKKVPNFLDYINEDGLKVIKPESVNIIRWGA